TSARIATACSASAALYNFFSSRPVIATWAPASIRTFAIEYPIPLLPPVTSAVAFCNFIESSNVASHGWHGFRGITYYLRLCRPTSLLFQSLQFRPLAHCDKYITGLDTQIGRRIELHDAALVLDGKNNQAILAPKAQLFERFRDQRASRVDLYLFDLEFKIGFPKCRRHIEKTCDMGTQHGLRQPVSNE